MEREGVTCARLGILKVLVVHPGWDLRQIVGRQGGEAFGVLSALKFITLQRREDGLAGGIARLGFFPHAGSRVVLEQAARRNKKNDEACQKNIFLHAVILLFCGRDGYPPIHPKSGTRPKSGARPKGLDQDSGWSQFKVGGEAQPLEIPVGKHNPPPEQGIGLIYHLELLLPPRVLRLRSFERPPPRFPPPR